MRLRKGRRRRNTWWTWCSPRGRLIHLGNWPSIGSSRRAVGRFQAPESRTLSFHPSHGKMETSTVDPPVATALLELHSPPYIHVGLTFPVQRHASSHARGPRRRRPSAERVDEGCPPSWCASQTQSLRRPESSHTRIPHVARVTGGPSALQGDGVAQRSSKSFATATTAARDASASGQGQRGDMREWWSGASSPPAPPPTSLLLISGCHDERRRPAVGQRRAEWGGGC